MNANDFSLGHIVLRTQALKSGLVQAEPCASANKWVAERCIQLGLTCPCQGVLKCKVMYGLRVPYMPDEWQLQVVHL